MPPKPPKCMTCTEEGDNCFRDTTESCLTCQRKDRTCVMPGARRATPDSPSDRSTPLSSASDRNEPRHTPSEDGPAGIRRPRDTPTVAGWGQSSHISTAIHTPSYSSQQRNQPVTLGKRPANVRSPDAENIEEREDRIKRLELALENERSLVEDARRRKAAQEDLGPSSNPLPSLDFMLAHSSRPRAASGASNSSTETVIPGFMAGSSELLPPESVVKNIKSGWKRGFSLVLLTDDYCRRKGGPARHKTALTYDAATSVLTTVEDELFDPTRKEEDLTYEEWSRAYRRFLSILAQHLPKYYERWKTHHDFILDRPELSAYWRLWLRYDIKLRERTRTERRIDVTVFQKAIFDELLPVFQAEKALEAMQRGVASSATNTGSATSSRPTLPPPPARSSSLSLKPAPSKRPGPEPGRCFRCGRLGHGSKSCTESTQASGAAILIQMDSDGNWTINGKPVSAPTSAPYADPTPTVPNPALRPSDPRRVTTPLLPNAWDSLLAGLDLKQEFGDVPLGLSAGFRIGSTRSLDRSFIIPNHKSALDNPSIIHEAIDKEISLGRYSGPFSHHELEARIGFFRTAPLGVVAKSTPGEFRIIQDFSCSSYDHPALNDEIDPNQFQCEWGFFQDVVETILVAPAGSEAATFDVDAAYRRMPVHPEDQPHTVVMWMDKFWVDHCVPFGAGSSNGIFGRCGDAMARICTARGLGPVLKWVDDFLFFRFPRDGSFQYAESDILAIAAQLGWPWKESKTRPFASTFVYLGFLWDIQNRSVCIPSEKREKYLARLREWLAAPTTSFKLTEKILGSLVHCTQVITNGRPMLAGLFSFHAAIAKNTHTRFHHHTPSPRAVADINWWLQQLSEGPCVRHFCPDPPIHDCEYFMDASTSFGIGVIVENKCAMWRLRRGWRTPGRDIGWAEMAAVELALGQAIAMGINNRTLIFRSDNQGVVFALRAGRSRNEAQNQILMRILSRADLHGLKLDIIYVRSEENPADAPSRGHYPSIYPPIPSPFTPAELVDSLAPCDI
ncbi:Quinol oxidase subunit 1/3 [Rhizoctonia solani]|uniref:Quinol oxidase subunit 1/3 n=1 Tax=Rhizoctonia solani TaxID=456999 RepID=A0A0K6FM87_9AGAM|nr:Quinol oxidase subunit 1/3 [Rhizoctonia solani]